jgi:2-oxoisovalerate dehydrogenase E1 component
VIDAADRLELYRRMVRIRLFEQATGRLYADGLVPGFVHLSIGQEASAVGACWPLRTTDGIVSTHRGHGHCLAKGASAAGMMAELMGRATGTCAGLGGSMHIADVDIGVYGANGIVAAGLPIAVGIATAFRQRGTDDVVVAFFGDGAIAHGAFHEAMNLAALWHLPVVFLCENNQFAEFSPFDTQHPVGVVDRAAAYAMTAHSVDGNDVEAVATLMTDVVERCRAGEGPALIEALTYRHRGHYEGDPQRYRDEALTLEWVASDPIGRLRAALEADDAGARADEIDAEIAGELEAAIASAKEGAEPTATAMYLAVGEAVEQPVEPEVGDDEPFRTMDAVREGLGSLLAEDDDVWIAGIDVAAGGNIFGLTRGLADRHPGRVLDTPISETAILGLAVGGSMAGTRPIVEIMYLDFIGVCFDQLLNQAAKLRFMTGGRARLPLVVRTQFGTGRSSGSQHSQSLEALLAHVPGLKVVMPSTPADTYGLLRAAVHDPNPVVFIEHRGLYGMKGPRPPAEHVVPIGKAAIRRAGADVTLVSWSRMAHVALDAADRLADEGVDVEVIDLRTISPLDGTAIVESVQKTGRLAVLHEAVEFGGFGAEIAAIVSGACFWDLDAPIRRIAPPFTPVPYAPNLEAVWLPDVDDVVDAVRELART